jgi:hypothetical protein
VLTPTTETDKDTEDTMSDTNTNMINALTAAVLSSATAQDILFEASKRGLAEASALTDDTLLAECIRRGINTPQQLDVHTVRTYLSCLDADNLTTTLADVDGAKLVEALGGDEGLWEMIDDKDRVAGDWLESNASDFMDRLDTDDLFEELRNRCR